MTHFDGVTHAAAAELDGISSRTAFEIVRVEIFRRENCHITAQLVAELQHADSRKR